MPALVSKLDLLQNKKTQINLHFLRSSGGIVDGSSNGLGGLGWVGLTPLPQINDKLTTFNQFDLFQFYPSC
ncbi:hypothetical protein HanRHA438_Chr10g0434551 [Helianthus annuus]|nr:hypothetical protein HanRHA438_Chr10g0434551 [Helianthus annuus]